MHCVQNISTGLSDVTTQFDYLRCHARCRTEKIYRVQLRFKLLFFCSVLVLSWQYRKLNQFMNQFSTKPLYMIEKVIGNFWEMHFYSLPVLCITVFSDPNCCMSLLVILFCLQQQIFILWVRLSVKL